MVMKSQECYIFIYKRTLFCMHIKLSGYQQSIYYKSQRTLVGLLVEGVARSCINSANADIENQVELR